MAKLTNFTLDTGNELVAAAPVGTIEQDVKLLYNYDQVADEHRSTLMAAARRIKQADRRVRRGLFDIGKELTEHKGIVPHGQWLLWLEQEFDYSDRFAQQAMNVWREYGSNPNPGSDLLSDSAMRILAGPNVPVAARRQAEDEAQKTGRSPSKARTQTIINQHKPVELKLKKVVGKCGVCGRALTDPNSVDKACGPECSKKLAAQGEPATEQPEPFAQEMQATAEARFVPAVEPEPIGVPTTNPATCEHRGQYLIEATAESPGVRAAHILLCEVCGTFQVLFDSTPTWQRHKIEFRLDNARAVEAAGQWLKHLEGD